MCVWMCWTAWLSVTRRTRCKSCCALSVTRQGLFLCEFEMLTVLLLSFMGYGSYIESWHERFPRKTETKRVTASPPVTVRRSTAAVKWRSLASKTLEVCITVALLSDWLSLAIQ